MKTLGLIGGMSPESTIPYYADDSSVPLFDTTALHAAAAVEAALADTVSRRRQPA